MIKKDYKKQKWFSLESLADFIAEYTKDGTYTSANVFEFYYWLDRKCKPKKIK
jgi:hypothetical protein